MSFTIDNRFTAVLDCALGHRVKLRFTPGSATALITGTETSFPKPVIFEVKSVKVGYPDGVCYGLPLASEMKVELDLSQLFDRGSADWTEVRKWIYKGTADGTGQNIWELMEYDPVLTTYTKMLFKGLQDIKPEKDITIDKNTVKFEFSCVGIEKACIEQVKWSDMPSRWTSDPGSVGAWINRTFDTKPAKGQFTQGEGLINDVNSEILQTGFRGNGSNPNNDGLRVDTILYSRLHEHLYYLFQAKLRTLSRQTDDFDYLNTPLTHWTLYDNDSWYDNTQAKGSIITEPELIYEIYDKNDSASKDGLCVRNSNNKDNLYSYKTPWDFLKEEADGYLCKVRLQPLISGHIDLQFLKPFEDPTLGASYQPTKSVTKRSLLGDSIKFKEGALLTQTAKVQMAESQGDIDYTEHVYEPTLSSESDKSAELKLPFYNQLVNFDTTADNMSRKTVNGILQSVYISKAMPSLRNLFTWVQIDGISEVVAGIRVTVPIYGLRLINDYCTVNIGVLNGETLTYSSDAGYVLYDLDISQLKTEPVKIWEQLSKWMFQRYEKSGMGYVAARAAQRITGNPKQKMIDCDADASQFMPYHLGFLYTVNIDDLTPFNFGFAEGHSGTISENAVLTEVEFFPKEWKSQIKLFAVEP